MTAITFPLKRFPGNFGKRHISFGGWFFVQPLVLMATAPSVAIVCIDLCRGSMPSMLLGVLPFVWACVTMASYMLDRFRAEKNILKAPLGDLKELLREEKGFIKNALIMGIILTLISSSVAGYRFLRFGDDSVFLLCVVSLISLQMLLESVVQGMFSLTRIARFLGLTIAYEAVTLWAVYNHPIMAFFLFIFSVNRLIVLSGNHGEYDLREFLKKAAA